MGYNGRKKGEREAEEVLKSHRSFLFLHVGTTDMVGGDRDSSTPSAYPLTLPCPGICQRVVTSRSAPAGGAANQRVDQRAYREWAT